MTIAGFSLWSGMAGPARSTGSRRSTLMAKICPDRSRLRRRRTRSLKLERLLHCCVGYPGILEVCHQGSGVFSCLVVNGPAYGTIWDGREDLYPTELTFGMWYRRWLERALRVLDNERLIPRLRVGMTRADVLAEVGGDWRARPALGRPVRFFEAEDIPVQLVVDERDLVVEVRPWPFI